MTPGMQPTFHAIGPALLSSSLFNHAATYLHISDLPCDLPPSPSDEWITPDLMFKNLLPCPLFHSWISFSVVPRMVQPTLPLLDPHQLNPEHTMSFVLCLSFARFSADLLILA